AIGDDLPALVEGPLESRNVGPQKIGDSVKRLVGRALDDDVVAGPEQRETDMHDRLARAEGRNYVLGLETVATRDRLTKIPHHGMPLGPPAQPGDVDLPGEGTLGRLVLEEVGHPAGREIDRLRAPLSLGPRHV